MAKMPAMLPPAKERSPWPPIDFKKKKRVTSADNWWTLQKEFDRGDVWDIIVYNFDTRDAGEVNWYLNNKLGCTLVTADRDNFRFGFGHPKDPTKEVPGPAGRAITLYIPHKKWTQPTPTDGKLKQQLIRVIRGVSGMDLTVGDLSVSGSEFDTVARKIAANEITVRHDPKLPVHAAYTPAADLGLPPNLMQFKFAHASTSEEQALMVHEAVHAALDVRRDAVSVAETEGLAFVAQSLAILRTLGPSAGPLATGESGTALDDKILELAWDIAITIDGGGTASDKEVERLHNAIDLHDLYKGKPAPRYDGV